MILREINHEGGPNEIAIVFPRATYKAFEARLAERLEVPDLDSLTDEGKRDLAKQIFYIWRASRQNEATRTIVDRDGLRLDSEELGNDLVSRMHPPHNPDAFNPDYVPLRIALSVFDCADEPTILRYLVSPEAVDTDRLAAAAQAAHTMLAFTVEPPSYA